MTSSYRRLLMDQRQSPAHASQLETAQEPSQRVDQGLVGGVAAGPLSKRGFWATWLPAMLDRLIVSSRGPTSGKEASPWGEEPGEFGGVPARDRAWDRAGTATLWRWQAGGRSERWRCAFARKG